MYPHRLDQLKRQQETQADAQNPILKKKTTKSRKIAIKKKS
jgi:hypothetical protein